MKNKKVVKKRLVLTAATGRRIEINGETSTQTFFDAENRDLTSLRDDVDFFVDDDANGTSRSLSGMTFSKYYSSIPSNPDIVKITGNGIYSNTGFASARTQNNPGIAGTAFGSVIGYIRRMIVLGAGEVHAAIVGLGNTQNSYAAYFKHMQGGTAVKAEGKVTIDNSNGDALEILNGGIRVNDKTAIDQSIILRLGNGATSSVRLNFSKGILTSVDSNL